MTEHTTINTPEAAGCLSRLPNRAGMSFLANQVMLEQMVAGGRVVVFDKGSTSEMAATEIHRLDSEQTQRVMRVGRKRNDGPVIQPKAVPYYRQFGKRR